MKTRLLRILCVSSVLALGVSASSADAQSLRQVQTPAEFPPASYKGTQYVDSTGCVFIRAGVDGRITWVPRVSRDRKPICGQTPTQITGQSAAAPRPSGAEQITLDAPKASDAPAAPMRSGATPAPAPRRVAAVPVPRPVPQARPRPVDTRRSGAGTSTTAKLRTRAASAAQPAPAPAPRGDARVLPAHVAAAREGQRQFTVPKGYRPAWEDDRLNPRRTEGTVAGWQSMSLVWTETVPRRLVDQGTGRDVTATVPLVYPYTDQAVQTRELGAVTLETRADGQVVKRITRNPGAAPRSQSGQAAAGGSRYVQVAAFGVAANAQATARQLQRTGLPVRIGRLTKGAKTYRLVLAGPFADMASAESALRTARRAGFSDAYIR